MNITHSLQQKVIQQYKHIIEHQVSIIEAQRQQIERLERQVATQQSMNLNPVPSSQQGGWWQRMEIFFKS